MIFVLAEGGTLEVGGNSVLPKPERLRRLPLLPSDWFHVPVFLLQTAQTDPTTQIGVGLSQFCVHKPSSWTLSIQLHHFQMLHYNDPSFSTADPHFFIDQWHNAMNTIGVRWVFFFIPNLNHSQMSTIAAGLRTC